MEEDCCQLIALVFATFYTEKQKKRKKTVDEVMAEKMKLVWWLFEALARNELDIDFYCVKWG